MSESLLQQQLVKASSLLNQGEVIAYPTEAVYGLGCDPFNQQAVEKLFHVKQRPMEKGVILVAASVEQIQDWIELIGTEWEKNVLDSWPGPITWVLPIKKPMPDWITGGRDTVAIRVSDHPVVQQLCLVFGGPIVSTSANVTTHPPAKSCDEVRTEFEDKVYCICAELGGLDKPTQIRDAKTGRVLR
ncbi:L-threonylcarbamoyladenylate synthase [Thiomicrorhabdus lithotrophica]|uniref:Threonylcarbamoyl-AMP synthase n=1 Tax=Thiomicrorhabdus lithotrophica TaxID=2949997 RepID=A0ABY8C9N5_9GAMM|nr:L-threonylcarbamoyladenylate synthase [Thiomicrorhabdus lithotrophica]WEJ62679.1 L-threonylcarbamoyladenylate synthase [Thiomicrorhabdus lithotrophica]